MQLRPIAAYAIAAAFALGVAGCSATPAAEEDPATSQSDTGAETGTEESQPAEEPAAEAPADAPVEGWPAEVPVPDGELQQDSSTGGAIAAAFQIADAAAGEAYAAELEAAGFAPMDAGTTEIAGVVAQAYQGNGHIVAISTVEAGDMTLLSVAIQAM